MISSLVNSACPEKRLLVACARLRVTASAAEEIRKLVAGPLDWNYLLSDAAENSVLPLLDRLLSAVAPDSVPSVWKDRMKELCRANAVRCLFLTAELIKILGLFESRGIQAVPYKGPVLAAQVYGDVALREFDDLDIILRQRDLPAAHDVLAGLGYRTKISGILSPDAKASLVPVEYNYRDETRGTMVEFQTEFTLRHFPKTPDLDDFIGRLAPVLVGGREVRTFSPEDTMLFLCVHGAKDFWDRLSWIADIAELIQSHTSISWSEIFNRAEQLQVERMLHLGLALACGLLDAPLPEEIVRRVESDWVAMSVATSVAERLLGRESVPLNALGRFSFRRRMVQGFIPSWRYSVRLAVTPAEDDWEVLHLPPVLAPLYVVLRPFRLLRKYGWRRRG